MAYPQPTSADLPRRALAIALLLAGVLLVHAALMTTERHATVMALAHTPGMGAAATTMVSGDAHHASGETGEHQAPITMLGDCPAQQAIFPLLSLAVLALFANELIGRGLTSKQQLHRTTAPPPLPLPLQRRLAFLQVFLI